MIEQLIAIRIQGEDGYALVWVLEIPDLKDQNIGVRIVNVLSNHLSTTLLGKFFIADEELSERQRIQRICTFVGRLRNPVE